MRILPLLGTALSLMLAPTLASAGLFSKEPQKELKVRTTAYTHTESDHIQYGKKTAAGGQLKYSTKYSSAAADWSKFPLGTKFKIDGMDTTFVVDDYGRALVGTETIDIYKPSRSAMNKWGVRHVDIKILEYGDFEKSREILEQRTKYEHVREMLAGMQKPGPKPQKQPRTGPFIPSRNRSEELSPVMQMASVTPQPTPAPAPKPAPPVAPAPSALPTPPVAPPPATPKPVPAPAPVSVADATPTSAPSPEKPKPVVQETPPSSAPAPTPVPTPAVRKFKPLQFASLEQEEPSPAPASESANVEPVETTPAPAAPSNELRQRSFRPLMASANG